MIRIIDTRSENNNNNNDDVQQQQISERNLDPRDNIYVRIGNIDGNAPPLQSNNETSTNCQSRQFIQLQNLQRARNNSNNNNDNNNVVEHVTNTTNNTVCPFEKHNPKQINFHVQISKNLHRGNDPVLKVASRRLREIQPRISCPNQNQRSTVLRHSSSVSKEEVYIDRCQEIHEQVLRQVVKPAVDVIKCPEDPIKVLKPEEINKNLHATTSRSHFVSRDSQLLDQHDRNRLTNPEKYHMLKKQLLSREPIVHSIPDSQSSVAKEVISEDESIDKSTDESIIFSEKFSVDPCYHPYAITKELSEPVDGSYSPEDLTLRYQVVVFLWVLLGERRLLRTGYPSASIHLVLWRVVHICCSVAGVKSAAAVPLPDNHNCGEDMLCFRDHVHRFLEVCAPTRDLWKQFGWASLTVDTVMGKIYKQELLPVLLQRIVAIPTPIRMAIRKLAILEKEENERRNERIFSRNDPKNVRVLRQGFPSPNRSNMSTNFRPILPKPPEKKKRGRPIKIKKILPDTGRIQRVMLWRFIMNLLEEPGNEGCIHWVKREEGIFRILNTDWLARIWGRRHGNPRMTYEKMARAMRTYYRSKVLQPVPRTRNLPRKLVYKFNPALVKKIPVLKESRLD